MEALNAIEFLLEQQVKHGDNTASEKAAQCLRAVREERLGAVTAWDEHPESKDGKPAETPAPESEDGKPAETAAPSGLSPSALLALSPPLSRIMR